MLGRGMDMGARSTPAWWQWPLMALMSFVASIAATPVNAQSPSSAPSDTPNVIVVLDSSRSMWGQIDGINKVVSARTAVSEIATRYQSKIALGLVAYGLSESASCKDYKVVLEPKSHKPTDVTKAVSSFTPKGSTPTAEALAAAAKSVEGRSENTTIILIADGTDNCKGDPCATVKQLRKTSPHLTFHAIGFDRKAKEDLKPLACIAENGGGTFTSAVNEGELLASVTEIVDAALAAPATPAVARRPPLPQQSSPPLPADTTVVARRPAPSGTTPSPPSSSLPATATEAPSGKAGKGEESSTHNGAPVPVTLAARITEAGKPIGAGLIWRVFDATPDQDGRYRLISTYRDAVPNAALPPGEYLINAAYGLSNLTKKVTVQSGHSVDEVFVLNTGGLRLGAVLSNGQRIPPSAVRYDIYEDETDQFGNRQRILADAKTGLIIRLNAGAYHIVSTYGDANAVIRADVAVEPSRLTEATVNHSAAKVTFRLVQHSGGEALADTQWSVLTPGGDVVKESVGALPSHILAAGEYTVLARHNGVTFSQEFSVDTGDSKQVEVMMR